MIEVRSIKNKVEHNEEILREISEQNNEGNLSNNSFEKIYRIFEYLFIKNCLLSFRIFVLAVGSNFQWSG